MGKRPGVIPELIIPILAIAFAIYYLSTVWALPFQAKVVGIYVSSAIGVLSLLLFIRFGRQLMSGTKALNWNGFFTGLDDEVRRWGLLIATALFIFLMPATGFVVTLFVYVFVCVVLVGGRERLMAAGVTAVSITATAFVIFILFVKVRFPQSAVDEFLKALVF
jgi:hypothetical protein